MTDTDESVRSSHHESLTKVESHLYAALNDGEMDDLAHGHVAKAYKLLDDDSEDSEEQHGPPADADVHGSFVARDLYPDYDDLHERVREHASERFDYPSIDTSSETWEIVYVGLEDGVVLYKVEHEKLGEPEVKA